MGLLIGFDWDFFCFFFVKGLFLISIVRIMNREIWSDVMAIQK